MIAEGQTVLITPLDLRGTLLMSAFWNMIFPLLFLQVARNHEGNIPGLGWWAVGQTVFFFAILFNALRGQIIPETFSIFVANGFLILGAIALLYGTRRFYNRPLPLWPWFVLVAVEINQAIWTLVWPDYRWRVVGVNLGCALVQLAHVATVWANDRRSFVARFLLIALALSTLSFLLRAAVAPFDSPHTKLFDPNPHQALYLLTQALLNLLLGLAVVFLGQQRVFDELNRLSRHDPLTGALNRRAVTNQGQYEIERQLRSHRPLSVLLMDIDHFKSINDRFGHPEGDRVLRDLVARTGQALRGTDTLGRLGGEEFIVILPETCAVEAAKIAERIRAALEMPTEGLTPYSVSIGVATREHRPSTPPEIQARQGMTAEEKRAADRSAFEQTLSRADGALYEAKRAGRNRVEVAPPETPEDRSDAEAGDKD